MGPQMTPLIPIAQVLISFAGYQFLAVRLPDGRIAIVFRHLCEALDVSRTSQLRRIQANPTLAKNFLLVRIQTPGGPQDVNALVVSVLTLWLGGFDLTRFSEEKCRLIIMLQEDAEEAFSRPFVVTPLEPPQQPKAPPSSLPPQEKTALSLPEIFQAVSMYIAQEKQQLEARLTSVEQENQRLQAMLTARDRQQMDVVAWMAEKGHELSVQAEQLHALTTWAEQLAASRARQSEQPGEARPPMPGPARLHALQTMPYQEYLQTPEWKATREAALKRALYRCQVCNTNETSLHAHHRTYERLGCEQREDVFVLCETCHGRAHPHASAKRHKPAGNTSPSDSEPEAFFPPFPDYAI